MFKSFLDKHTAFANGRGEIIPTYKRIVPLVDDLLFQRSAAEHGVQRTLRLWAWLKNNLVLGLRR